MKAARVYVTIGLAAALLLAFFLLPLPVSRVHETGLVVVDPAHAEACTLPEPARLTQLEPAGHWGQAVRRGQVLARFKSEQLEVQLAQAVNEQEEQRRAADNLRRAVFDNTGRVDDDTIRQIQQQATEADEKAESAGANVKYLREKRGRLSEVRAPCDGVVVTAPKKEEVGKLFDRGYTETQPVFVVGDPTRLVVRIPVSPQQYRVLKEDLTARAARHDPAELDVTVYVKGRSDREFAAKVRQLPEQNAATVPVQLTQRGGGPLAVKPADDPNLLIPLAQTYLVEAELTDPDAAIKPGQLAVVKVHAKWRSAAWWVGQTLANALDYGLYR